ncbi:MAG: hypothetical protein QM784_09425 [Polyangiaceae bacterium]
MPNTPVKASEADITDELEKGGPALGAFLKATGLAVADSQKALDETFRETAKMLSETQIDVIAIFEQVVDDEGQLKEGIPKKQKLPLVNYVMPVGYAFRRVYLEADMKVQEFNAANGMNLRGKVTSLAANANFKAGMFGASGGASMSVGHSSYEQEASASVSTDTAAGSLHLEATLEPRQDVTLPAPIIIQKGPKLAIRLLSRTDIQTNNNGVLGPVTGRQAIFEILLKKTDGSANGSKEVNVTISDPMVSMTGLGPTDAGGKISITLKEGVGCLGGGGERTGAVRGRSPRDLRRGGREFQCAAMTDLAIFHQFEDSIRWRLTSDGVERSKAPESNVAVDAPLP